MARAMYPGSFDPVTLGHLDIVERSAKIFDRLYVAVSTNVNKDPIFTIDQRIRYLESVVKDLTNVEVVTFSGLLVDAAEKFDVGIIVKGLRAISDFEYEFQMALMNKKLGEHIETLFMATCTKYSYLSSSLVKEVARLGGSIRDLVPEVLHDDILKQLRG